MGYGRLEGCGNCLKYSMFVLNLITCIGGMILIALSIWTFIDKFYVSELLGTNLYSGSVYIMLITGILVTMLSCFGYFGAIKESKCLLVIYFLLVLLIFVTMVIGGVLGYVFREKVETTIENGMYASLKSYGNNPHVTDAWDATQTHLRCCGVRSPADWYPSIPNSCCVESAPGVRQQCQFVAQQNPSVMYNRGCINETKRFAKDHALVIGTTVIVVACLMLLGLICSCGLYRKISTEY